MPEPAPRGSGTESSPRCLTPGRAYSGGELRAFGRSSREISDEFFGAVCDGHSDSDFAWLPHGGLFVSPFPRDAILSLFLDGSVFCFRHGSYVWLRPCVPNYNRPMVVTIAGYTILQGHRAMGVNRSRHMACVLAPARLLVDCFRPRSDRPLLGSIPEGSYCGLVNVGRRPAYSVGGPHIPSFGICGVVSAANQTFAILKRRSCEALLGVRVSARYALER